MRARRGAVVIDSGAGDEITLPTRKEVCPRCEGTGTHVNPNIDGDGITASEWAEWDDDDRESYMRGDYDVTCEECFGHNVIDVVDESRLDPETLRLWRAWEDSEAADRATQLAERRMGA